MSDSKEEKKKIKKAESPSQNKSDENEKNSSFDFGGIPSRDLKKNLGCG